MRNSWKRRSWPLLLGVSGGKRHTSRLHTDEWHAMQGYAIFHAPTIHSHGERALARRLVPKALLMLYHTNLVALTTLFQSLRIHETSENIYLVCSIKQHSNSIVVVSPLLCERYHQIFFNSRKRVTTYQASARHSYNKKIGQTYQLHPIQETALHAVPIVPPPLAGQVAHQPSGRIGQLLHKSL